MSGCYSLLKFLVFTINFLLWLLGLGMLGVSLWLLFDSNLYLQTAADQRTDYYLGTYIFLGTGATVTIMGFLGCCGAWKESPWMLGSFFSFLLIIFFVEIAVGIMVYFQASSYDQIIGESVKQTVQHNYQTNNTAAMQTFDLIQEGLECCGEDGPRSWYKTVYNKYDFQGEELGIPAASSSYSVPRSCCSHPETPDCSSSLKLSWPQQTPNEAVLHTAGCTEKLVQLFADHQFYILGLGCGVLLTEILGMLCSLCLCCAVKRIDDMKA